jgi:hypothetical protein
MVNCQWSVVGYQRIVSCQWLVVSGNNLVGKDLCSKEKQLTTSH